jgi:hypothetical protein
VASRWRGLARWVRRGRFGGVYARHRLDLSLVEVALAFLECIRAGRRDELEPENLVAGFATVLAVNT